MPLMKGHSPQWAPRALAANHPASPSPGQRLPLSPSSSSLGPRHSSAGAPLCLPPTPSSLSFCLSLAPAAPSGRRAPLTELTAGGQHQRWQCQPCPPHGLVPAARQSWAYPSEGVGAPCSHRTRQPCRLGGLVSRVVEVRRPAPYPGAPPTSTWTCCSSVALLRPSLPLPHSSASCGLGPSPHPCDPLMTLLSWLGVLACLCNSLRGALTSPHQTVLPLRMVSACLGVAEGGSPAP